MTGCIGFNQHLRYLSRQHPEYNLYKIETFSNYVIRHPTNHLIAHVRLQISIRVSIKLRWRISTGAWTLTVMIIMIMLSIIVVVGAAAVTLVEIGECTRIVALSSAKISKIRHSAVSIF